MWTVLITAHIKISDALHYYSFIPIISLPESRNSQFHPHEKKKHFKILNEHWFKFSTPDKHEQAHIFTESPSGESSL